MKPRKYRAIVEFELGEDSNVPNRGDPVIGPGPGYYSGTITSVTPILSAEDVIDEIQHLVGERLKEPRNKALQENLKTEIWQVLCRYRPYQEKPE